MDYSTFLVVDCKTTIWEKQADQPAGQTNEIIGVNMALVDTAKNQISEQDIVYVKPRKSKISSYCERLFGITQSQIDEKGIAFEELYRKLRVHYMSRDRLWGSWGLFDRYALDKQCKTLELENLFSYPHVDIQHLYSMMTGKSEGVTSESVLKACDLTISDNSAANAAQIYMRMAKGLRPSIKSKILGQSTQFGRSQFN